MLNEAEVPDAGQVEVVEKADEEVVAMQRGTARFGRVVMGMANHQKMQTIAEEYESGKMSPEMAETYEKLIVECEEMKAMILELGTMSDANLEEWKAVATRVFDKSLEVTRLAFKLHMEYGFSEESVKFISDA